MRKMKQLVKDFKTKCYIEALVNNGFDISKTVRELEANRRDMLNHVGDNKECMVKLARELGYIKAIEEPVIAVEEEKALESKPLIDVKGLDVSLVRLLNSKGIFTNTQLLKLSPDDLTGVVKNLKREVAASILWKVGKHTTTT
jgi:hypothetical protein